jgi:hypothetical protein
MTDQSVIFADKKTNNNKIEKYMPEETLNSVDTSSAPNTAVTDSGESHLSDQIQSTETTGQVDNKSQATSDKGEKQASLKDVISKSLKGETVATPAPGEKEGKPIPETNPDGSKKDTPDEAKKKEEDARLDKHPRFQELVKEKNALKKQFEAQQKEVEDYRHVTNFMTQNRLVPDEVNKGFEIMAAMKNDPLKAAELLAPYIRQLNQFAGINLPAELQQQVDGGLITQEAAQQLARHQNQNGLLQRQIQERQLAESQATQRAQQQAQHEQWRQQVTSAVGGWEQQKMSSDPDFKAKYPIYLDAVKAALSEAPPQTPQQAVDLAESCWVRVSNNLRAMLPRQQQIRQIPSSTSSSNGRAEPKSYLEAVRMGLRAASA